MIGYLAILPKQISPQRFSLNCVPRHLHGEANDPGAVAPSASSRRGAIHHHTIFFNVARSLGPSLALMASKSFPAMCRFSRKDTHTRF